MFAKQWHIQISALKPLLPGKYSGTSGRILKRIFV